METFRPQCWKNELVVMESATYGRRTTGRCIVEEEVAGVEDDPRYLGCFADVLDAADERCSGKTTCEIRIPDPEFEKTKPCRIGMKMYLEASYSCIPGTKTHISKELRILILYAIIKSSIDQIGLHVHTYKPIVQQINRYILQIMNPSLLRKTILQKPIRLSFYISDKCLYTGLIVCLQFCYIHFAIEKNLIFLEYVYML